MKTTEGKTITPIRPKWKGTMADRERLVRQLNFEPVDRCFNMEFGYWQENFERWSVFTEHGVTCNEEAERLFSFDRIEHLAGNVWLSPPFEPKVVSETEASRIVRNPDGLLGEVPKDGHSTIPHFIKSSIETPDDWKRVKEERFNLDSPGRIVDVEAILRAHPNDRDYPLSVGCGSMIGKVRDLLTVEGLAYLCADEPEMIEDMVETSCRMPWESCLIWNRRFPFMVGTGTGSTTSRSPEMANPRFIRRSLSSSRKR